MARKATFTDDEITKARQMRDEASTARDLRKALSVLLVAEAGLDANEASNVLGTSGRTVFRNRASIRHQDQEKRTTWGGRRRYGMALDEEREFLHGWETKAAEGGILSVPPIHAALVQRLGHSVPISTTYRLLARHGWRKVHPDTKHPKNQPGVQEEFKKNSPGWWRPRV